MSDMVYSVIQAQALHALGEMLEETKRTEPGPNARLHVRLRTTIGRRLIQLGTLLEPSGTNPRRQNQIA